MRGKEGGVAFCLFPGHPNCHRGVPAASITPASSGRLLERQNLRPHPGALEEIDPMVDCCPRCRVGSSVLQKAIWPALHPLPPTFCSLLVTFCLGFAPGRPRPLEWPPFYWSAYWDLFKFLECLGNSGFSASDFSVSDVRWSRACCPHWGVQLESVTGTGVTGVLRLDFLFLSRKIHKT